MRLVSVVTSTRWSAATRLRISPSRFVHLTLDRPHFDFRIYQSVGRMICSTTTPAERVSSYGPGVADT